MTTIPTLDLREDHDRPALVAALREAMATVGFLQITGHGVPAELIERAHDAVAHIDEMAPLPHLVGTDGPRFDPITTYDWQVEFMRDYVLARYHEQPVASAP